MVTCTTYQFSDQSLEESVLCNCLQTREDHVRIQHITAVSRWSHFHHFEQRFIQEHFLCPSVSFPHRYLVQTDPTSKLVLSFFILTFLMLTLFITPASCAVFTTETVVTPDFRSHQMGTSCHRHFAHRVDACVHPFLSRLDVTNLRKDHLKDSITDLTNHVCLEYQLVLLCLHSALTDCPSLSHIKLVQATLGSQWAVTINRFCSIPAKISTPSPQNYNKDPAEYNQKSPSQNFNQFSQGIVHNLIQNSSNNIHNVASSAKPEGGQTASLADREKEISHSQREESGIERPSNGGSHDLNINILNFVNYYQYDRPRVLHETERSRPSLVQVRWAMSAGGVGRANIYVVVVLLCLIVTFNKCTT